MKSKFKVGDKIWVPGRVAGIRYDGVLTVYTFGVYKGINSSEFKDGRMLRKRKPWK